MAVVQADAEGRVVIPGVEPGDVLDVHQQGNGRYMLVRAYRPAAAPRKSREACLEAMSQSPLRLTLSWEELRQLTREP